MTIRFIQINDKFRDKSIGETLDDVYGKSEEDVEEGNCADLNAEKMDKTQPVTKEGCLMFMLLLMDIILINYSLAILLFPVVNESDFFVEYFHGNLGYFVLIWLVVTEVVCSAIMSMFSAR